MLDFSGKVAIVTGGSSGIGRAAARLFARHGAAVVIGDLSMKAGNEIAAEITDDGGQVAFVATDVTSQLEVDALVETAMDRFGRLDMAANMAGVAQAGGMFCSNKARDLTISVNLMGTMYCTTAQVKAIRRSGGKGAIVNCASVAGIQGAPDAPYYAAAKHGIVGFSKSVALELSREGIRVNIVSPGLTRTGITENIYAVKLESMAAFVPMGRLGDPEDLANAIIWLCSDAAKFVTGADLHIDGGHTAGLPVSLVANEATRLADQATA